MTRQTPLYEQHVAAGGRMVPFAGWDMPLNYGSQIAEHKAVRESSGVFDVSHMTIIDVTGTGTLEFLQRVLANDVGRLEATGAAAYGAMLNEAGGIIDDLITYRTEQGYRLVVNASTRDKVLAWLTAQNGSAVNLVERDLAMLAVQGPQALATFVEVTGHTVTSELEPFAAAEAGDWSIARTGYTGEDGVEVMLPGADAVQLWQQLLEAGVVPAGLGARDTLRLEAGLNLYGQDMDEGDTPLVSNMGWTVHWQPDARQFSGRAALQRQREEGPATRLTGVVLEGRGVMRHEQRLVTNAGDGQITSGAFSPTLGFSVALARVPRAATGSCQVEVRGKLLDARLVKPPFVRHGKRVFE